MKQRWKATIVKVRDRRAKARERRIAFRAHYHRIFLELAELARRSLRRRRRGD